MLSALSSYGQVLKQRFIGLLDVRICDFKGIVCPQNGLGRRPELHLIFPEEKPFIDFCIGRRLRAVDEALCREDAA